MDKFEFFLKDEKLQALLASYPPDTLEPPHDPANGYHKGLVFSIKMERTSATDARGYILTAEVRSVYGKVDPSSGVPDNPTGNIQIMCPHPPPCTKNLQGVDIVDPKFIENSCY